MIEINLLPEELKKKEPRFKKFDLSGLDFKNIPVLKIGLVFIFGLIAMHVLLYVLTSANRSKLAELSRQYDSILPQKAESDALKSKAADINRRVTAIDELMVKRFSWTKKLNALSDSVIPGIWLSELEFDEGSDERQLMVVRTAQSGKVKMREAAVPAARAAIRYLVLSGYASSKGEEGTAVVGKFIKSLKENSGFYSDIKDIELKSIRSDLVASQEVMNFKISCFFKEME